MGEAYKKKALGYSESGVARENIKRSGEMIRHIVMWRIKNRERNASELKAMLESLEAAIPEILEIEVGINFNASEAAADVVLCSTFESREALSRYQKHPDHVKVADFLREVATDRRVVDYEV